MKASATNAIVCVSWNERLFGRSKRRASRNEPVERRVYGLKCCVLPSRCLLFSGIITVSMFVGPVDKLAIDSFESKTPFPSNKISRNHDDYEKFRGTSRSRKIPKPRPRSDMINVHFDIIYRWKIWNGIRKEGEGIEGGRERRSASVSNSTTRRTRSLIDIVYRFDRSPRPPAQTHESRPRSTVAKFVKGFDRFHLSRDATRQRRRAR